MIASLRGNRKRRRRLIRTWSWRTLLGCRRLKMSDRRKMINHSWQIKNADDVLLTYLLFRRRKLYLTMKTISPKQFRAASIKSVPPKFFHLITWITISIKLSNIFKLR